MYTRRLTDPTQPVEANALRYIGVWLVDFRTRECYRAIDVGRYEVVNHSDTTGESYTTEKHFRALPIHVREYLLAEQPQLLTNL